MFALIIRLSDWLVALTLTVPAVLAAWAACFTLWRLGIYDIAGLQESISSEARRCKTISFDKYMAAVLDGG